MSSGEQRVTRILETLRSGDDRAGEELLPLVYDELRALARARLARTPPGNTLQPTALVHEAYMRLIGEEDPGWENRAHFFGAAAQAMRDILVEQARRKATLKRGGGRRAIDLDHAEPAIESPVIDMLALDEALRSLEASEPRAHQVVMLHFFAGLTMEQTAQAVGVSERTAAREWRYARAKLKKELDGGSLPGVGAGEEGEL
ncbi:MAG: sigma-70 family RNA polymerase sigma factor [Phycisphaeraceae bacterium]|nr:MAG: sigma-70 family RNA polymerase sigma factor [Phycisphaeraceae bacterium]